VRFWRGVSGYHKAYADKENKRAESLVEGKGGDEDDGKRGTMGQMQDYKRHHKPLHRKHRGVIQLKAARTLDWMVCRAKGVKGVVEGVVHHREEERGFEAEG